MDPEKSVSSWQTASLKELAASGGMKGPNAYSAILGVRAEPYGVYWLNVVGTRPDNKVVVENLWDRGKRKVKSVRTAMETELLYPAVAGGNLRRYGVTGHVYVLLAQDPERREPFSADWMLDRVPLTYAYLSEFKDVLLTRGSRVIREFAKRSEFYAMYAVSQHSLAPYRVTWKRMASRIEAAVLSDVDTPFGRKAVLSLDTTSLVPTDDADEAHFLCAVLNSALVDGYIRSFSSAGRGFGAPSVIKNVAIPKFDKDNPLHRELSGLSMQAHDAVAAGASVDELQTRIDAAARKLWNIDS